MRFHTPSFLLGCAVGAAAVVTIPKLRPVAIALASAAYEFYDTVMARVAMAREDLEDFFAEARARARAPHAPRAPRARTERPVASA